MANLSFTLTDYGPVYVTAPEVKIPEEEVRRQAKRWLELNACKDAEAHRQMGRRARRGSQERRRAARARPLQHVQEQPRGPKAR